MKATDETPSSPRPASNSTANASSSNGTGSNANGSNSAAGKYYMKSDNFFHPLKYFFLLCTQRVPCLLQRAGRTKLPSLRKHLKHSHIFTLRSR